MQLTWTIQMRVVLYLLLQIIVAAFLCIIFCLQCHFNFLPQFQQPLSSTVVTRTITVQKSMQGLNEFQVHVLICRSFRKIPWRSVAFNCFHACPFKVDMSSPKVVIFGHLVLGTSYAHPRNLLHSQTLFTRRLPFKF